MCVCNNTAEDHELSLLFFLWYLRQGQGVNRIWKIKDGAQERKIIGGSQQLSIKMAKELGGMTYRLHGGEPLLRRSDHSASLEIPLI
jgi:monoamine oxidase